MVYMLTFGGILMGSMLPYIAYMDPMGYVRLSKLHDPYVHEMDINIIWKGPIATLSFLHF